MRWAGACGLRGRSGRGALDRRRILARQRSTLERILDRAGLQHTMTYRPEPAWILPLPPQQLTTVSDPFGRQLNFTHDAKSRVATMTDPAGGTYAFEYDGPSGPAGANNLTKVTFPGSGTRVYFYAEPARSTAARPARRRSPAAAMLLTGLQDENGVRFATWTYDCSAASPSSRARLGPIRTPSPTGRAIAPSSIRAASRARSPFSACSASPTADRRHAAGGERHGTVSRSSTYDTSNNPASRTDFNGNLTNYTYDLSRNLETSPH